MGHPSIYPTGTTIYKPEKCFSGFTLIPANGVGLVLIDMNGREVNIWANMNGFPAKMLKGGDVIGQIKMRPNKFARAEYCDLSQVDWDGNIVWQYNKTERIKDGDNEEEWMARFKSDFQREGNPVGYYSPELECKTTGGNTIMLVHRNVKKNAISRIPLLDDAIIEVDWEGNIVWEWRCSDHFDELNFSEAAKNVLARNPDICFGGNSIVGDWLHVNSMSVVGPNKWYDAGDERFHPDNIIWDAREANIIAITSKKTGKIVWQLGPEYDSTPELRELGWIIGQHHAHIIPKGVPGAGNLLVFDNGGSAGYGLPNPGAPTGIDNAKRDYSRVLEIDPTTLKIIWQYTPSEAGYIIPVTSYGFYSPLISSAQRLPNGNTLICEGCGGRLIEVTVDHEIVWEYIAPYYGTGLMSEEGQMGKNEDKGCNTVYRAYRVPYEYCPKAEVPEEVAIDPIDVTKFRMPGAAPAGTGRIVQVAGTLSDDEVERNNNFCVATDEQTAELNRLIDQD